MDKGNPSDTAGPSTWAPEEGAPETAPLFGAQCPPLSKNTSEIPHLRGSVLEPGAQKQP